MLDDLDNDLCLEWFVRKNGELDEKLPLMAKEVIARGIDYTKLNEEEIDQKVVSEVINIMEEYLYSFNDMTQEEVAYCIEQIWIASVLVECVEEGIIEEIDGEYKCKE